MRCWIPGSAMREQLAEVWRVFRRQRAAAGGFLALAVIVMASPSIVVLSRIDPEAISADVLGRPSLAHAMGTDYLGRDILGRVLHGVNTSLLVGASVAAIALCIGLVLGTTAGFYRGSIDHVIMRAADGLLIVPTFFLVLAVAFIFGGRLTFVIVMLGLTTWPQIARIVRAEVLALKEEAFVQSARALGAGDVRLMFREILPNTLPPVVAMIAPNPLVLIVHWAAHARRIRLGTAVITAPYWNPLRAAGEIALADILTGGRLEVGFGRGAYQYEFDRMAGGMAQERGGDYLRELVPAVQKLWQGDYAHDGTIWKFPRATSVPKPLQQPHPRS